MKPYAIFDLHCDTLTDGKYTRAGNPDTLDDPSRVLSLSVLPTEVHWAQFYAIFIPDEQRGQAAIDYFDRNRKNFDRQMQQFSDRIQPCRSIPDMEDAFSKNKTAAFLTVENGSALAGDLSRVQDLADVGVRAITLVWNGENEIGSGHSTHHGLSSFGKAVIPELERCGILADISHLNDTGFDAFLAIAKKPFLATHSNARAIAGHKRNLTDAMILEMVHRDCLIGLNYFVKFLSDDPSVDSLDQLYRHVDHFLALGAHKNLALGSDFDGATLPPCLSTPTRVAEAYDYFLARGLSQQQVDGIFYQNAQHFLTKNLASF